MSLIVENIGDIVEAVRMVWDPHQKAPYYLYGHYQSIADELIVKSKEPTHKDQKYPLILLGIDPDYSEREINANQIEVDCNVYILDETRKDWFTSERFDNVFKTVLYPIKELFLENLFESDLVHSRRDEVSIQTKPIPYWGTQTVQGSDNEIVSDPLDALLISMRDLVFNKIC